MADSDANSPELFHNLELLGRQVTAAAAAHQPLSSESLRAWQTRLMQGLAAPAGEPPGIYRGEPGLEAYDVEVGGRPGTPAERVGAELGAFDGMLAEQLGELDRTIRLASLDADLTVDAVEAVLILCAWVHGEWVRMHPFPNGNERIARLMVNSMAVRYGLPAFLRVRPMPGPAYAWVAPQAMVGQWAAAVAPVPPLVRAAL